MNLKAYSMYDYGSETFAGPFFVPSDRVALRMLDQIVKDPRSDVSKYPKDYALYHIGSLDTNTGRLEALDVVVMVAKASQFAKQEDPRQMNIPGTEVDPQRPKDYVGNVNTGVPVTSAQVNGEVNK